MFLNLNEMLLRMKLPYDPVNTSAIASGPEKNTRSHSLEKNINLDSSCWKVDATSSLVREFLSYLG